MKQMIAEIISKVLTKENVDFSIKFLRFIVTALFIPIVNWCWYQINYLKFKNMIKKEYVNSIEYNTTVNSIGIPVKRLMYLKDNEITHVKSPIQFKYIRIIEYTLMFLSACQKLQNTYIFESPFEVNRNDSKIYIEKYDYLKEVYKQRVEEYVGLRRDTFMTEFEFEKLKDSVKVQLKKLHD
ncbi:hypothetical protein PS423_02015 [Pediococcus acidilactici]|uniref:hypothetical protein n=1 Tax=Pediococcus acidilactici TaxID=1254 RepID=UPI002F26C644